MHATTTTAQAARASVAAPASSARRRPQSTTVAVRAAAVVPSRRAFAPALAPSQRRPLSPSSPSSSGIVGARDVVRRGLFGLGIPELAVIAGVAALIFGPSKLPSLGKELGKTVKSFQTAAKEFESELKTAASEDDEKSEEKKGE